MSHLFKTGNSIFKVGDNIYKINDRLNVVAQNMGGFGGVIEGLRFDPIAANNRVAISSGITCRIINTITFELISTITFSGSCIGFAWDSPNDRLYVTAGGKLHIINTTTWIPTDSGLVSGSYNGVALDPNPANGRLVITGGSKLQFYDIATQTITTTMLTGFSGAYGLAFDPTNINRVYVGNYNSNYISIVDTDNFLIVDTISGFGAPIDITFDLNSANNRYLVSEYSFGQVAYVDRGTHGIIKRLTITDGPEEFLAILI
ncbi:YncE family protein [Mucilaginibacter antarcticus]|uniref:YncE family protein n=1 Tax=Mucilaginibacter antarcticus TaxID=1855725 RepID=UPI00363026DE